MATIKEIDNNHIIEKTSEGLMEHKSATFSEDELYRYSLRRVWNPDRNLCAFIMLNPSTADENVLDPTVRRCYNYAQAWGYGGIDCRQHIRPSVYQSRWIIKIPRPYRGQK